MKLFKGFNKDMTCTPGRGIKFQYEEGKTYHEDNAKLCSTGFHACENPLDCFGYYRPCDGSIYREVVHTGRYAAASLTILSSVSTAMTSIPFSTSSRATAVPYLPSPKTAYVFFAFIIFSIILY